MFTPIIKEPVFSGTRHVVVESAEVGADIEVLVNPDGGEERLGERHDVNNGSIVVDLSRELRADETLRARAIADDGTERRSRDVTVQNIPPLTPPTHETTLYAGATCIWVTGALPGSTVRVVSGTEEIGRQVVYEPRSRVSVRPLKTSDSVQVEIEIGGTSSDRTEPVEPVSPTFDGPYQERLPTPTVREPLLACEDAPRVRGLVPGATVELFADGDTVYEGCTPLLESGFRLGNQLEEGQVVTAKQSFADSGLSSETSDGVRVGPAERIGAPVVYEPIYEGDSRVRVYDTRDSAELEISVDGSSVGLTRPNESQLYDLEKLRSGQEVKARQRLCGVVGPWSNVVEVRSYPGRVDRPMISEPHYAGATKARIEDRVDGSEIRVYLSFSGRRGDVLVGTGAQSIVDVAPPLREGTNLVATQTVGEMTSDASNPVEVLEAPENIAAPTVVGVGTAAADQIASCARSARVEGVVPGARINVQWDGLLIATTEAVDDVADVPIVTRPWPSAAVHASQSIGPHRSADSTPVQATGFFRSEFPDVLDMGVMTMGGTEMLVDDRKRVSVKIVESLDGRDAKCPVPVDTPVTLEPQDPNVVDVAPNTRTVTRGSSTVEFTLRGNSPGGSTGVRLLADGYHTESYNVSCFGEITGTLTRDTLEVGETTEFRVTIEPPAPADIPIYVNVYAANSGSDEKISTDPNIVKIPAGQTSAATTVKATAPGADGVKMAQWSPGGAYSNLDVPQYVCVREHPSLQVVPRGPGQTAPAKKQTPNLPLSWVTPAPPAKVRYVERQVGPIYGTLTGVENVNTKYPNRCHLWFPTKGTSEDAFDEDKGYLLEAGEEATPSDIGLPTSLSGSIWIRAVPKPLDQPGRDIPVYVSLKYQKP